MSEHECKYEADGSPCVICGLTVAQRISELASSTWLGAGVRHPDGEETQLARCPVCSNNLTIIPALRASSELRSSEWVEALTKSMESAAQEKAKYEKDIPKWYMCHGAENALRILLEWYRRQSESASTVGSEARHE